MKVKLLNAEHKENPASRSGASAAYMHTDCMVGWGAKTYKAIKILTPNFQLLNAYSLYSTVHKRRYYTCRRWLQASQSGGYLNGLYAL